MQVMTESAFKIHETNCQIEGKTIHIKTGRLARQADGACEVSCGDTKILVTCVGSKQARQGVDFLPLTVDYEEKLYSVGRVPGSLAVVRVKHLIKLF